MHRFFPHFITGPGSVGLLILRVVTGAAFIFHGWPKVMRDGQFVMFGWMGPKSPMPGFLQAMGAFAELGGGILLILGLLTPLAAFLIACNMAVAIGMVHLPAGHPFVSPTGGHSWEPAADYLAIAIALILLGPGAISLDALLFRKKSWWSGWRS